MWQAGFNIGENLKVKSVFKTGRKIKILAIYSYVFLFFCQVRTPVVNSDTKVLVPGIPGHSAAVKTPSSGKEKKKSKRKPGETEVKCFLF